MRVAGTDPGAVEAAAGTVAGAVGVPARVVTDVREQAALWRIREDGAGLATELGDTRLGDLEALQGVVKFPVRIKCATLAWNTLQQGLDELKAATP